MVTAGRTQSHDDDVPMEVAFTPLQLNGLLAWYRSDQGVTQTSCAKFVSLASNFLSTTDCSWLDGLSSLTIALDVRPSDVTTQQGWVSRWDSNGQFVLRCQGDRLNPGAIVFIVADSLTDPGGNYVKTANNVLSAGLPARVVVVFDSGEVTIYVNGAVVATNTFGTIPGTLTSGSGAMLGIGADYLQMNFHDGLMSRLCLWAGTALTPDQVAADFNTWIGVDPASGEPVTPTHAWRLDEVNGPRQDCIGNIVLTDNNSTGSEAHISQVDDLSGNGFHARIRPINGPTLVSDGLGGKPTIRHTAANGQFLVCGLLTGPTKPSTWSLYTLAMCSNTAPVSPQLSYGLFNTFSDSGADVETWLTCVFSDTGGSSALPGSFGMGCGDGAHTNQANSLGSTYSASTWFQLTGIFPGGITQVNTWFNGSPQMMSLISAAQAQLCPCSGDAHPAVIGAATAEGTGLGTTNFGIEGIGVKVNDFFDGQWADIAVCGADTSSQREDEEAYQRNWWK